MIIIITVENNIITIKETEDKILKKAKKLTGETMKHMIYFELSSLEFGDDETTKEQVLIKTLFDDKKLFDYNQKEALIHANELIVKDTANKVIEMINENKEELDWDTEIIIENLKAHLIKANKNQEKLEIRKIIDKTFEAFEDKLFMYNYDKKIEVKIVALLLMFKLANESLFDLKK